MKKRMVLVLVLGSLISTSYSRHQEPKRLQDLIGGAPVLAVRFVEQMKRCKDAKELGDDSKEERYCDFDPLLIEGEKGNGKTTLYRVMESETGVHAHVLTVANVGHQDPTECVRRIKEQIDYVAASAEASKTPRYLVIEEVEDFGSGVQSGIKDLTDREEYWGKIQFVLTSNCLARLRADIVDRCGINKISKYRPNKKERLPYLEGFGSELGLQPTKAQLQLLQESSNKLSVRSMLLLVKKISKQSDGSDISLSHKELKGIIEESVQTQKRYNDAHGFDPGFYKRHEGTIGGMMGAAFYAGVGATAGIFKEELRQVPGLAVKVVKASPGVVVEGAKQCPGLVATSAGYVWHIFF